MYSIVNSLLHQVSNIVLIYSSSSGTFGMISLQFHWLFITSLPCTQGRRPINMEERHYTHFEPYDRESLKQKFLTFYEGSITGFRKCVIITQSLSNQSDAVQLKRCWKTCKRRIILGAETFLRGICGSFITWLECLNCCCNNRQSHILILALQNIFI